MAIGQTNSVPASNNTEINSTTTYSLRESKLVTADTTPTSNGQITWKYE